LKNQQYVSFGTINNNNMVPARNLHSAFGLTA